VAGISTGVGENHFFCNGVQAMRKFSHLKGKYMEIIDNTKRTGSHRKTFKYFEMFQDIYSRDHNVVPILASSRRSYERQVINDSLMPVDDSDSPRTEQPGSSGALTQPTPRDTSTEHPILGLDVTDSFLNKKRGRPTAKEIIVEKIDLLLAEKKMRYDESKAMKEEVLEIEREKLRVSRGVLDVFQKILDRT
jgi:hypothetical protein